MGGEQSRSLRGGARQGLTRGDVESLVLENAKRLQLILTHDKRNRRLPGTLHSDLKRLAGELFSRQLEVSKGNTQYVEHIRSQFDTAYQTAFQPKSPEQKILVRSHVDEIVQKVKETIENKLVQEVPERRIDEVQKEQLERKAFAGDRNARARAGATRRARSVAKEFRRMKGGVLSWFTQRSTEPTSVPFRNYTRSLRAARRKIAE